MKEADQKTIEPWRKRLITLCIQSSIAFKVMSRLLIKENHLLNLDRQYGREYRLFLCSKVEHRLSKNTANFGSIIDNHLSVKKVIDNEIIFEINKIKYIKSAAPHGLDKVSLNSANTHWNQAAMFGWPDTSSTTESDRIYPYDTSLVVSNIVSTTFNSDKVVVGYKWPMIVYALVSVDTYVG